jgi:copper homeostasis protein (lipoprotein)
MAEPAPARTVLLPRRPGASRALPGRRRRRLLSLLLALLAPPALAQAGPATPLDLPATFTGSLPCADCPGIDWHLDLWPDGRFHLLRRYRERQATDTMLGRWRFAPDQASLLLHGGREVPLRLAVQGRQRLRLLAPDGAAIESTLPYELTGDGTLRAAELSLTLNGEFRYLADAAVLTECLSGQPFPVLMEGAYVELERAYLAADKPEPGAALFVQLDARIVDRPVMEEGPPQSLLVERVIALRPTMRCERAMSDASLENTYWRLLSLAGEPVSTPAGAREAHLVLDDTQQRVAGVAGCNRFTGSYTLDGDTLLFSPLAMTRMLCPPPLDAVEAAFAAAVERTAHWRVHGTLLELYDDARGSLAVLEAVYLP